MPDEILRYAAARKQPVAATYDGQPGLLCPHVGGRKSGRLHVFCYQFGGSSNSVDPLAPEGRGVWRCLAVEKLSQVELRTEAWHTVRRTLALDKTAILWILTVDGTFKPALFQSCSGKSNSVSPGREVIGAATKSSSPASRTTAAAELSTLASDGTGLQLTRCHRTGGP